MIGEEEHFHESATATLIGNYYVLFENRKNYSKVRGIVDKDKVEEADRKTEEIAEKFLRCRTRLKSLRLYEEWKMLGKIIP